MLQSRKIRHVLARAGRAYWCTKQMDRSIITELGILSIFRVGPTKRWRSSLEYRKKAGRFRHLQLVRVVYEASGTYHGSCPLSMRRPPLALRLGPLPRMRRPPPALRPGPPLSPSSLSDSTLSTDGMASLQAKECEADGCCQEAKLQCPRCITLGIQGSYFCSQVLRRVDVVGVIKRRCSVPGGLGLG